MEEANAPSPQSHEIPDENQETSVSNSPLQNPDGPPGDTGFGTWDN